VSGAVPAPVRVKVCGLTRAEDAAVAAEAGADYLGVILAPGRTRSVAPVLARHIFESCRSRRVGVFVDAGEDELAAAADAAGLDVLQLHGDEPPALCTAMRGRGFTVWKALRPRTGEEFAAGAQRYAGVADALLVDGWSPVDHGGTGARFPWAEVGGRLGGLPAGTRIVAAGGLNPANVAEAIRLLHPFAVDVSSGVEDRPGRKDHDRVRAFVAAARAASRHPAPDA
jgi:phosphoribosylanthranilate isomerase